MRSRRYGLATIVQGLWLCSCTTIGPTVQVSSAPGKADRAFAEDRRACMASTDASLQPVSVSMNLAEGSVGEIAAGNARLQTMYNDSFAQCMSARGDTVLASADGPSQPTSATLPRPGTTAPSNQASSDPISLEADHALAPVIAQLRHDCEGEDIVAETRDVSLRRGGTARLVALTEPHGGNCFGQPGENDYLVERMDSGWALRLEAEPGSITVVAAARDGYADLELHSLGLCVYRYGWNGKRYAVVSSHDCALPSPPTMSTLPGLLR